MADTNAGDPRIGVTNNESAATKHLVEAYSETPVVDEQSGRTCTFCGNAGFRRSRLRFTDLLQLVMLKFPVRCTRCGQRQYVAYGVASVAQPAKAQSAGPSPDKPGSWKQFTGEVPSTLTHARPASTMAEPVAERLDDAFKPGPPAHLGIPVTNREPVPQPYAAPVPVMQSPPRAPSPPSSPAQSSTPPASTPSRRSDDSGIW